MKWQVALTGNADDLEDLSEIFCSPELRIVREEDRYLLESSSFDDCLDSTSLKIETDKLLASINATKTLVLSVSEPIRRGPLHQIDENGNRHIFTETTLTGKFSILSRIPDISAHGTAEELPMNQFMPKWIPLIDSYEKVRRAFDLVNHDFNSYVGLYKIIEVVREDNYTPVMRCGEFYNEIDRFKQTAESYGAIGKDARHAHSKFIKPEDPMTINQARNLVSKILQMWLNSKIRGQTKGDKGL